MTRSLSSEFLPPVKEKKNKPKNKHESPLILLELSKDLVELARIWHESKDNIAQNNFFDHVQVLRQGHPQFLSPFPSEITWTKALKPDTRRISRYLKKIFSSRIFSNFGPFHEELEKRLRTYLKVENLFLVNNATIGLMLALRFAYDKLRPKNPYIITTPFTFPATSHAVKFLSFDTAFADIDPHSLCLCPEAVENVIKKHGPPVAVIPVHVFGNVADLEAFESLRRKYGFFLIYDSAHAFGVEVNGKGIGSYGDFSVFSLHATKIFHTAEGGIVTFSDPAYAKDLGYLRSFGIKGVDTCFSLGINAKLSELNCALGLALWDKIEPAIKKRKQLYNIYAQEFSEVTYLHPVMRHLPAVRQNYGYATFLVAGHSFVTRDVLCDLLKKFNVIARKYFSPLLSDVPCYKDDLEKFKPDLKVAEEISQKAITLPLYPDLNPADIKKISHIVKYIFQAGDIIETQIRKVS
ncbi:MAG: DegT/DnrJ/EryC1/StrS family aminotransferase [Deltaproteobacteria bacterium]|nr:DegT/DnrJ/EryC1/StrS family aminotransferase [Deltaproteobacteria bacterium]